jgi:hypothetical protein
LESEKKNKRMIQEFSETILEAMRERREMITEAFRSAFLEEEYLRAVTVSTGDANRVSYRLFKTREILAAVMQ